jgi:hypothetical protein
MDRMVARFNEARPDMEALVRQVPVLRDGARRDVLAYVGGFFDILNTPARRQRQIDRACRPMPG